MIGLTMGNWSYNLRLFFTSTVLASAIVCSTAQASALSFCEAVFGKGITATLFLGTIPTISVAERKVWEETFSPSGKFVTIPSLNNATELNKENLMVWWVFEKLPTVIQDRLKAIDYSGQEAQTYLRLILRRSNVNVSEGYLRELIYNYLDFRTWKDGGPVTLATWIERGLDRLDRTRRSYPDLDLDLDFHQTYTQEMQVIELQRFWDSVGVQNIAAVPMSNGKFEIEIGHHRFVGRLRASEIIIDNVPLSLVATAVSGSDNRPAIHYGLPKNFAAVVGLDGRFYIPNQYRGIKYSGIRHIQVRLAWPLQTVSLQKQLQLVGANYPSLAKLDAYRLGEISFEALLPNLDREKFVFDPGTFLTPLAP